MKSNLQKKVLTVRGKKGTHRQTYYVADDPGKLAFSGHTVPTNVTPRERASVHYGMLWAGKANKGVDHALEAIAKTHDVPSHLFKVPIRVTGSLGGAGGQYYVHSALGGNHIQISKYGAGPASTTAHEYGHFLDHHLFGTGKPRMNSLGTHSTDPKTVAELTSLKRSLYNSAAVASLVKKHESHVKDRDYMGQQRTQYLLMPAEIFARAYSQWIGTRNSPQIRRELHEFGEHWGSHGYQAQWSDADFAPIAREFDRLFANRGLRKGRR